MGTFYQFPPGGGKATTIPAGGVRQLFGRRPGTQIVGRLANLTVVATVGTATFQYWDENDTPSALVTLTAGQGYHDLNRVVQRFELLDGGSAQVAAQFNDPPADIDVKTLLSTVTATISGTIKTDVGQGSAPSPNIVIQSDNAGLAKSVQFPSALDGSGNLKVNPQGGDVNIAGDAVGLAKAAQLPASLDSGALKVAVEKPLTGAGSVQVHDIGG